MPRGGARSAAQLDIGAHAVELTAIATRSRDPFSANYETFDPNPEGAPPSAPAECPLQADLRRLRELATARVLECLSDDSSASLLHFLGSLVVRDLPDCARLPEPVRLCAPFLLEAHGLALHCARSLPRGKLAPFEAPAFQRGLIRMLASPDSAEQAQVSALATALCAALPDSADSLLSLVRGGLAQAAASLLPHHFVAPACEFLHRYHSEPLHYPDNPEWFLAVCPALFASEHLPAYAAPLAELCDHYYDLFDQLPPAVLRSLLAHWPRANPAKAAAFVEHAGVLLSRMTDADAVAASRPLFARLLEALQSASDAAAHAVAALLARRGFARRFRVPEEAVAPLRAGLAAVAAGEGAAAALQAQTALEQLPPAQEAAGDRAGEWEAAWLAIGEAGAETEEERRRFRESVAAHR